MSASTPIAVVQMGLPPDDLHTRLGDPASWFAAALGKKPGDLLVAKPYLGQPLPDPDTFSMAIISGSWSMVTDREDWSERTAAWARMLILSGKPLLGICYGHQIMAHAMGGVVDYLPDGRELGTLPVTLTPAGAKDPLLRTLPAPFMAHLAHEQSVLTVPTGAQVLAGTPQDPHQILRYGPNALSLQFHPEFTVDILDACVARRSKQLAEEGQNVPAMRTAIHDTPDSRGILLRFVEAHSRSEQGAPRASEPRSLAHAG